ncbi:hypothetical protein CYMTET_39893 [Cymbomonas tetramitiformis]|uniref:Pentapeptide repeat-containing protein n=1 Tax=Cymbomonas tetramitiformis TaxID=36881 RepID=A0AAE0F3T1_9CHLO|nr:hypothetical protein CYMTET_39893 [Cymbomonas tetramitiformis]
MQANLQGAKLKKANLERATLTQCVGWESAFPSLPRDAKWSQNVEVLRNVGAAWEVVAWYIPEEGLTPFHFSRQRQEELIGIDTRVGQGVQLFAANMVADA